MTDYNRNEQVLFDGAAQSGDGQQPVPPNLNRLYPGYPGYNPPFGDPTAQQGAPYFGASAPPYPYPVQDNYGGYAQANYAPSPYNTPYPVQTGGYSAPQYDPYMYGGNPAPTNYGGNPAPTNYGGYPQSLPPVADPFYQPQGYPTAYAPQSFPLPNYPPQAQPEANSFDQLAQLTSRVNSQLQQPQVQTPRMQAPWPPKQPVQEQRPVEIPANVFASNVMLEPVKSKPQQDSEIFRVAEELSEAVLLKSYSRAFNDNNLLKEGKQRCIEVDGVSSDFVVSKGGDTPYPLFDSIEFSLGSGGCCAIVSDLPLAAYALTRTICEIADTGSQHGLVQVGNTAEDRSGCVFYIGGDDMLPPEMTCEEFLLFTLSSNRRSSKDDAEKLSILLSQLGMNAIYDMPLADLSHNERILILVLAATLNPGVVCVGLGDPKFQIGAEDEMLARRIFALLSNRGKCCLLGCASPHMMSVVANKVLVIARGHQVFFGDYRRFVETYCRGIMSFNAQDGPKLAESIERSHPEITALCRENLVYIIRKRGAPDVQLETLIKDVIALGADFNTIVMDEKSFALACKEALGK